MVKDLEKLNRIWREILVEEVRTWVVFKNGTIVVCRNQDKEPREYAIDLMKTMSVVAPACSHGDFTVFPLDDVLGWVVNCHHPDILNYVSPEELEDSDSGDMMIGLHGRDMRGEDAKTLDIIHVEQR